MRIYLNKDEIKSLQESGDLLTKRQVIDKIMDETGLDVSEKLLLKYCDYRKKSYSTREICIPPKLYKFFDRKARKMDVLALQCRFTRIKIVVALTYKRSLHFAGFYFILYLLQLLNKDK